MSTTTTPRTTTALVSVTCRRCTRYLVDTLAGAAVLCPRCRVWTVAGQQPARAGSRPRVHGEAGMQTTVVNCKKSRGEHYDIYIGRQARGGYKQSKWANPYTIGPDGTRDQVIAKYEAYLQTRPDLLAALPELRGKVLGCWCKPLACHGDVLARLADEAAA